MTDDERAIAFYRELWVSNGTQSEQHIISCLAAEFAAVAERVKASARVCSWCHGSGLHPGPYDDVPTCDRCAGRGVTFGGEA